MIKTMIVVLSLAASAGFAGAKECSENELAAGTVLDDGTVAGEKQALAYFQSSEPELFSRLSAMSAAQRKAYAEDFVWFQRVGNCRGRQKEESIRLLRVRFGLTAALNPCAGPEHPAGSVLPDGSIVGEKQALTYFKTHEPELHGRVLKLPPQELRARFPEQLMWFQQVGNCRTRQKEESIRQLKAELAVSALSGEYKAAEPVRKAAIEKELRQALSERFDADAALLDHEAASMEQALEQYERESKEIRRKLLERKKHREAIIEKRLKELLGKS